VNLFMPVLSSSPTCLLPYTRALPLRIFNYYEFSYAHLPLECHTESVGYKCAGPACFQRASLLASGRRPISAVVAADLFFICVKIYRPCGLQPLIAVAVE